MRRYLDGLYQTSGVIAATFLAAICALVVVQVILNAIDYADRNTDLDWSVDPKIVLSGKKELSRMDEERDQLGRPRS